MKVAVLTKARPEMLARITKELDHVVAWAGEGDVWDDESLAKMADVEAMLVAAEPVNEQLLAACPRLKIVQRLGVGYNTLDLEAAARRGIPCCNVAGVNKEAVAEHGMALILALATKLVDTHQATRAGDWHGARLLTQDSIELAGKTLGVIGLGATGGSLAVRARSFGMGIVYNDVREIPPETIEKVGARFMEKDDLFRAADFVSINTDLNETTAGMVDARRIGLMKQGAYLICCARGGIIDETALRDALESGRLAGAGIDVFAEEPMPPGYPLLDAKNIIVTAHVAGVNPETSERSLQRALDNMRAVVERGEKPRWVLNGVGE